MHREWRLYPDNVCQDVHGSGASKNHDSPSTSQRSNFNAPVVETHLRCFSVDISEVNEPYGSRFQQDDYTINTLREVGNTKERYAHLATFSTDYSRHITHALILVWFQIDAPTDSFPPSYIKTGEQVKVQRCYENYGDWFDTSPIRRSISVQTPDTINLMIMESWVGVFWHMVKIVMNALDPAGITALALSSTE